MKKILIIILLLGLIAPFSLAIAAVMEGPGKTEPVMEGPGTLPKTQTPAPPIGKLQNPLKVGSVQGVVYLAVDIGVWLGVCFAILAIIWVGFQMVLAQGKPEKIEEARKWLLYIIVGLAILISAKVIVEIIKTTFINAGVVDSKVFTPK